MSFSISLILAKIPTQLSTPQETLLSRQFNLSPLFLLHLSLTYFTTFTPIHLLHIHLEPLHYFILLLSAKVWAPFTMINLRAQQSHDCPLC